METALKFRHGRYLVLRELAAGGQGRVFLAVDQVSSQQVVLKVADLGQEDSLGQEFNRLRSMDHPNLLQVLDLYRDEVLQTLVLVEEFIEGRSLQARVGELSSLELAQIEKQLLDALSYLLSLRIRHGDIKPANVMLRGSGDAIEAILIDFGFSDALRARALRGGTPAYLAPELQRNEGSSAADLWALGLTLIEAREGISPPLGSSQLKRARESSSVLSALLVLEPQERLQSFQSWILEQSWSLRAPQRLPFVGRVSEQAELSRALVRALDGDDEPVISVAAPAGRGASRLIEQVLSSISSRLAPTFYREAWFDLELLVREIAADLGLPFDVDLAEALTPAKLSLMAWAFCERQQRRVILGLGREAAVSPAGEAILDMARRQVKGRAFLHVVHVVASAESAEDLVGLSGGEVRDLVHRILPVARESDGSNLDDIAQQFYQASDGQPALLESAIRRAIESGALHLREGLLHLDRTKFRSLKLTTAELPRDPLLEAIASGFSANCGYLDRPAIREILGIPGDRLERAIAQMKRLGFIRDTGRIGAPLHYLGPGRDGPLWQLSVAQGDEDRFRLRMQEWYDLGAYEAVLLHADRALSVGQGVLRGPLLLLAARSLAAQSAHAPALERLAELKNLDIQGVNRHELALLESSCWSAIGKRDQADLVLEQACEEPGLPDTRAQLLSERVYISLLNADLKSARIHAEAAYLAAESPISQARSAVMLATAQRQLGEVEEALLSFERADSIFSQLGDDRRRAAVLANRAMLLVDRREPSRAMAELEEARSLFHEAGSVDQLAATTLNLGVAVQHLREFDRASALLLEAERLFLLVGDQHRAILACASRAISLLDAGRLVEAKEVFQSAKDRALAGDFTTILPRIELETLRMQFLRGASERSRRGLLHLQADDLDGPSQERLLTLQAVLDEGCRLDPSLNQVESLASELRSRDLIKKARALSAAITVRSQQKRPIQARSHFRRLKALLSVMERDMDNSMKSRFHRGRVIPMLEELLDRVEMGLESRDGAAFHSMRVTMSEVEKAESLEASMGAVARGVLNLGRALRVYVVSWDGQKPTVVARARRDSGRGSDAELSTMILKRVASRDEALVVADASIDDVMGFAASVQALGLRSVACFPLLSQGERKLMLYLDTPLKTGAFDSTQLATLEAFCTIAKIGCSLQDRALRSEAASRQSSLDAQSARSDLKSKSFEVERLRERSGFGQIVGESESTVRLRQLISNVAPTELNVLITGETGTGKEVIAQAIHRESARSMRPFVAINCANLSPTLMESELFGHKKGAFTGADRDHDGVFVSAEGGTIFLDEVGELELGLQAKLLRVLDAGELRPVGSEKTRAIDVRIVAATNQDVRQKEQFRQDLFFRLAQMQVATVPLRDRRDDLPELIEHFLGKRNHNSIRIEAEAIAALTDYDWPGNVRELINVLERAKILGDSEGIKLTDLPEEIWSYRGRKPRSLEEMEVESIREALRYTGGEKKAAATVLGISRTALYEKLKRYGPHFA